MSIILATITLERVIVVTDSYAVAANGPARWPKIFPLVSLAALISGRGSARLIAAVAMEAGLSRLEFDELAEALPSILRHVGAAASDALQELPVPMRATELMLAGFSGTVPTLASYRMAAPGGDVEECRYQADAHAGRVIAAPWDEEILGAVPTLELLATREGIIAAARAQCKLMNDNYGFKAAGGVLTAAVLKQHSIVSWHLGDLDEAGDAPEQDDRRVA
jgi:hypothetical protein